MKKILISILSVLIFSALSAQVIVISEARSKNMEIEVTVTGIITNGPELGTIRYIQDNTAGIGIYSYNFSQDAETGDSVTVTGTLKDYHNLLELDPVASWIVHSSGHRLPEPFLVTIAELNETNEGMLVKIENVLFNNAGNTFSGGTYTFSSVGQNCQIYIRVNDSPLVGELIPSQPVTLIGINSQYDDHREILVRSYDDLIPISNIYLTSPLTITNLTQTGFDLHWSTNTTGSTEAFWGNTPALELGRLEGEGNTLNHHLSVTGASPSELIYIQASSVFGTDTARSAPGIFITQSASTGDMKVYFNNTVDTTVSSGTNAIQLINAIDDTLISYIGRAKYSIDLAIYNYNNDGISDITAALNLAHQRDVEVRIVTDKNVEDNAGWEGLDPDIGRIVSPQKFHPDTGIMHNKFVVFDALSNDPNDPIVWTGSTNFTSAQINDAPNNVIIIQDQSLAKVYRIEFEEMFGSTGSQPDKATARFGPYKKNNTPHELIIGGSRVESYFSPTDGTNARIEETIKTADYGLYVNTMLITRNFLADAIVEQENAGTDAKVIVNSEAECDEGNVLSILQGLGLDFRDYTGPGTLHHKTMIVDPSHPDSDPLVLTGCHNWSSSADILNDENTLIIHNAEIANIYHQEFVERFKQGKVIGLVLEAKNDFVSMDQGDTLNYYVFDNDEIPGAVILTINQLPKHGIASGLHSGIITYIPDFLFEGLDTISYKVCSQINSSFCDSAIMVIYVMKAIGFENIHNNHFQIYPVPATDRITLFNPGNSGYFILNIYNMNGQLIHEERLQIYTGANLIIINPGIPPGIYILELRTKDTSKRLKILIR